VSMSSFTLARASWLLGGYYCVSDSGIGAVSQSVVTFHYYDEAVQKVSRVMGIAERARKNSLTRSKSVQEWFVEAS
jgi:hypothetical protein